MLIFLGYWIFLRWSLFRPRILGHFVCGIKLILFFYSNHHHVLKRQCHEIFDVSFFYSWTSFPQAPEYPIRMVSSFFENSLRYSQGKWKNSAIRKVLIVLFGPFCSRVNILIHFCFQVHFKQSDIVPIICHWCWLPVANIPQVLLIPVSLTPVANLPLVSTPPAVPVAKYRWCNLTCEYPENFQKYWMNLMLFSGAWGKLIQWKKPESKNLVTLSL